MELENNVISYEDFCGKYAKEMNDLGFCLEEYIEYLKNN